MFIGWYVLDVDDSECFEVTRLEEDDSEYEQGTVLCVTKMARQHGTKTWFSINEEKTAVHGLQTWQSLVVSEVIQVTGFGDESYVRISQFWRDYKDSPTASKADPRELLERPEPDIGGGAPKTHVYPVEKLSLRYDGREAAVTGGPKLRCLQESSTRWIAQHHPEFLDTRLMRYCRGKKIQLVFTAPYKFDS